MKKLSERQSEIVKILSNSEYPVIVKDIANQINCSVRTVQYDLRAVEDWAYKNDIEFVAKQRVGVIIKNPSHALELIGVNTIVEYYNRDERISIIIIKLLTSDIAIKVIELEKKLLVSKSTIFNDLELVMDWLNNSGVNYSRGKLGIQINESEAKRRKLLISFIYSNIDKTKLIEYFFHSDYDLLSYRKRFSFDEYTAIFNDTIDIEDIKNRILIIEEKLNIKLSDLAFVGMIIHISLMITRLKEEKSIEVTKENKESVINTNEFKVIKKVLEPLSGKYDIKTNDDEICYIAMHIMSSQLKESMDDSDSYIINRIIEIIFEEVRNDYYLDLSSDLDLIDNIKTHLYPTISRIKFGINTTNPMLESLKETYGRSFALCKRVSYVVKEEFGLNLSEDEIGYLTIYVELGLDRIKPKSQFDIYNVVTVCGMGLGASRILSQRIQKQFSNIRVVEEVSAMDIGSYDLSNIDFVLSTLDVSISLSKPVIIINAMLNQEDIDKIGEYMLFIKYNYSGSDRLNKLMATIKKNCDIKDEESLLKDIKSIFGIKSKGCKKRFIDLIDESLISCNIEANSWSEAVELAAKPLLKNDYITEEYVNVINHLNNKFNHYFMLGAKTSMPHAPIDKGAKKVGFALATLKNPIEIKINKTSKFVSLIIILVAVNEINHVQAVIDLANMLDEEDRIIKVLSAAVDSTEIYEKLKEEMRKIENES
jgi:transcriptional antiterminator/mannitol/fructose-specific phosphotransferase system IIA component (Ntr-type)